ncbi:MAG: lysophospholipid acyltransferase family protein [Pseudomonadota bacterium]
MIALRSLLFQVYLYTTSAVMTLGCLPLLVLPRRYTAAGINLWSRLQLWGAANITGITYEIRGAENLPDGPCLIASKHQSMWDTIFWAVGAKDPAIVLKKELTFVPLYGWYAMKAAMISIDRGSGPSAIRKLVRQGRKAVADGRPIMIFPEGSRMAPDAEPQYKPGAAALYTQLDIPCIPVALNSGMFWARRALRRQPGTIVVNILPAIQPGLKRREFMAQLEAAIEPATDKLVADAKAQIGA